MKITKAHLVATAKDMNALIQPEDNPFKPTAKTTSAEAEAWIKEAVTVLEPEDKEVLNSATIEVLKEMGLTDWMGSKEEPAEEPAEEKKTEKPAEKKSEKKSEKKLTKKQIVIDMISSETGATIEQIAQEIVDKKIDSNFSKNCTVVKLWLSKMGFDTKKKAIEVNPIFKMN